jgi:hypothetical protein
MVESYLTTLEEQPEFTRASQPDSVAAAWLGCRQSFLDEAGLGCYEENGTRMLSQAAAAVGVIIAVTDTEPVALKSISLGKNDSYK